MGFLDGGDVTTFYKRLMRDRYSITFGQKDYDVNETLLQ